MSRLIDKLFEAGQSNKNTNLGGVIQWAMLHIESQDKALEELQDDLAREVGNRVLLENALLIATQAVDAALVALKHPICPPIEFTRDIASHINRSAAEGDPDYMLRNGLATTHIDLRETASKKKRK